MRRYFIAALIVMGFTSLAMAQETKPDRRNSFVRVDVADLCAAFGVLDPVEQQEIAPTNGGSVRSTILKKNTLYLLTCDGKVRIKQGNSSVTAAATNTMRESGSDIRIYTGDHEYLAAYGDGAGCKCTLTRLLCPIGL